MRRAKIYVTDIQEGDMIASQRSDDYPAQRVFKEPKWISVDQVVEVYTTLSGVETRWRHPASKMVWIELP